ncbi:MAG: hypothetical protein JW830_04925 [Bacteroidales bacterium]|nr:hypothetical protein [Bacteroidales bacterium]
MELAELQIMWKQYDNKLSETTRLNKEILKRMLQAKPEKRLNGIRIKAAFNLILPLVLISLVLLPGVQFRNEIDFYFGILLFGTVYILFYLWAVKYFLLTGKVDFTEPVVQIRKSVRQMEKYKIKITRLGFFLIPFGMIGVFLMSKIPIISKSSIFPLALIVVVFIGSVYFTFKYQIFEQFKKINSELDEIEQLERNY